MNRNTFLLLFLIFMISCIKNGSGPDLGRYNEQEYTDQMVFVTQKDSIHCIVEQYPPLNPSDENILITIENRPFFLDTIKIEMKVKYGSYSSEPDPDKELIIEDEIVYVWYANTERPEPFQFKKVNSEQTALKSNTSPKPEYYNIETIVIKKSNLKKITTETLFYYGNNNQYDR